jgi:SagB-type dehydrogenase family enzyme
MKKRHLVDPLRGFVFLALVALLIGCVPAMHSTSSPASPAAEQVIIPLPSPNYQGTMSLEETLAQRRSIREFEDRPLTDWELGQLLWAAQGLTNDRGFRTVPSAGALYPLEVYVATAQGIFHYQPQGHHLVVLSPVDARPALYAAALDQEAIRQAPALFAMTAVYERTISKYGQERSPRYVHLEAGHAAQNLLLQAVALNLGAVPIGAFHDKEVQAALGLTEDHEPLYLIPVGHPR